MPGAIVQFLVRRKRPLLIAAGVASGSLLLLLLAGPPGIASMVGSRLRAGLRSSLRGGGEVGRVSFSWPCSLAIEDLRIHDERGGDAVSIARASARLSLGSLLGAAPSFRIEA